MRVLYLRPEGSDLPSVEGIDIVNISIFSVQCLQYDETPFRDIEGIAFTSVNAVRCFHNFEEIRHMRIFSIGPETAEELVKHGFNPVYPEKHTSRDLALLLLNSGLSSVVAFRSRRASQDMKEILSPLIDYREFYDYDLVLDQSKLSEVKELLQRCEIDVVVLTSSLIAKSVANFIKDCHKVVTIGPMTSTSLRTLRPELKFIESRVSSIKGTIDVLESLRGGDNFG